MTKIPRTLLRVFYLNTRRCIYDPQENKKSLRRIQAREVAEELGIHVNQIYNWRTQFNKLSKKQFRTLEGVDYSKEEVDEIKRLKHENAKLKEENELLKKITAYFSNLKK